MLNAERSTVDLCNGVVAFPQTGVAVVQLDEFDTWDQAETFRPEREVERVVRHLWTHLFGRQVQLIEVVVVQARYAVGGCNGN